MNSVSDLIAAFGGPTAFGRALGHGHGPAGAGPAAAGEQHRPAAFANDCRRRNSIPVRHWPRLLVEAKRRGVPLTADDLLAIHFGEPADADAD